jgi:hypothetical protein
MSRITPCILRFGLFWLAAALPAAAAEVGAGDPPQESLLSFTRLRGLFDIELPETVRESDIKLTINPHFGDLTKHPYLRIPLGAKFGLNDHTEVSLEAETYLSHGLRGPHSGHGFYALHYGAKYRWLRWLKPHLETSSGFDTTFPVGRPPVALTDGLIHITPFVVFSKTFASRPRLAPFVHLGADFVSDTSVAGYLAPNLPRSHSVGVAPGFIYDAGPLKYTLVLNYTTTAPFGKVSDHYFTASPGVLWRLPSKLSFGTDANWVVGFGMKWSDGPSGNDFGTSVKVRGEFNFHRVIGPLRRKVADLGR